MKLSQKMGLFVLIAALAGWVTGAATGDSVPAKKSYEYWVKSGQAVSVVRAMEVKLNEGFEVDRLETAQLSQGYTESYVVVVLKREK